MGCAWRPVGRNASGIRPAQYLSARSSRRAGHARRHTIYRVRTAAHADAVRAVRIIPPARLTRTALRRRDRAQRRRSLNREFEDTVGHGDALAAAGNYFEAVLAFERAKRVAYNNKLKIDEAALDARLARAPLGMRRPPPRRSPCRRHHRPWPASRRRSTGNCRVIRGRSGRGGSRTCRPRDAFA